MSIFAAGIVVRSAVADVSLYEPFNYNPATVTQLEGQSPDGIRTWNQAGPINTSGDDASTGRPHPVSGNLTLPVGMPVATGNMVNYGSIGTGARIAVDSGLQPLSVNGLTLYYSFAIQVNGVSSLNSSGQPVAGFIQQVGPGTGSQTAMGAVVYLKPGSDTSHYKLGMSPNVSPNFVTWDESHDYPLGSTQFVVGADTMTTAGINMDDVSHMWINPASLGGAEPSPSISPVSGQTNDMNSFGSFILRREPPGTSASDIKDLNSVLIDELRLGQTYAAVTPILTQIPGDANGDGTVNSADFDILAAHFNQATGQSFSTGDFNGDAATNALDFNILATHFGQTGPSPALGALVPEPAGFGLILAAAAIVTRRRLGGNVRCNAARDA